MTYLKDPQALESCTTGFDIADVLEERSMISIADSKTSKWRVRLRSEMIDRSGFDRGSLPEGWEIGRVRIINHDDEQYVETDLVHVETVESFQSDGRAESEHEAELDRRRERHFDRHGHF